MVERYTSLDIKKWIYLEFPSGEAESYFPAVLTDCRFNDCSVKRGYFIHFTKGCEEKKSVQFK